MFENMINDCDTVTGNNILASLRSSQPNFWHAFVSSPDFIQVSILSFSFFD